MKLSGSGRARPSVAAALQFVDDEIAKIVAEINAHRALKSPPQPGNPPPKGQSRRARAA